jgi:hypothetical protein
LQRLGDPKEHYPPDVYRGPLTKLADPQEVDLVAQDEVEAQIELGKLLARTGSHGPCRRKQRQLAGS